MTKFVEYKGQSGYQCEHCNKLFLELPLAEVHEQACGSAMKQKVINEKLLLVLHKLTDALLYCANKKEERAHRLGLVADVILADLDNEVKDA